MDISFIEIFGSHALISLLPGLFGAIFGVAIGNLLRRLLGPPESSRTMANKLVFLIPWRSFVLLALVILLPSPYATLLLGLGIPPGLLTVFLSVFLLGVGLVFHGEFGTDPSNGKVEASWKYMRTALVASVGFAVVTHEFGSGSAGFLIRQGMQLFEYGVMWSGYAIVGILAMLVDISAGVGQLLLIRRAKPNMAAS